MSSFLGNDNLSGLAVATALAKAMAEKTRRYSYRFIFIPATIGAITWMARNEAALKNIRHGLVITGVGDRGTTTYKKSRRGDAEVDRAMQHVLRHDEPGHCVIDFFPYGYDERQYCSPAFNLPVGCLMRTPHGQYPEYHTSADNLILSGRNHSRSHTHIASHSSTYSITTGPTSIKAPRASLNWGGAAYTVMWQVNKSRKCSS